MDEKRKPANGIQGVDKEWSATAPRGLELWKLLSDLCQRVPSREVDKADAAMLEPLGIGKGIEFNTDTRQTEILLKAAAMGERMLLNMQTNPRFAETYREGTHWCKSFEFTMPQITEDKLELDERGVWLYQAVRSPEGMVNPTPGAGQVYMTTNRDFDGGLIRADQAYVRHVPADVPVGQFWSRTLCSENTRQSSCNGGTELSDVSLDCRMERLQLNDDGSIDHYVGPDAPLGMQSNPMKTVGDDGWFVCFRRCAPEEPFFDTSFTLPDLVEVE